ncbi:MAG TPA: MASE1 domain-containing protein, partial [Rhizomicrobium sp.]|nr:MASE1 domain-containing protein [Rhizomicrobium sp.]
MQARGENIAYRVTRFIALTLLFALLYYTGSALYQTANGLTSVKPFCGVALAILLINGRRWLWPVLVSGTLGAILAKLVFGNTAIETISIPIITTASLYLVYSLCQNRIGQAIDFRAWKQLVRFIAIAAIVSMASSIPYGLEERFWNGNRLWENLQAWFIPTTLSYVIFTPVIVLLATAEKGVFRNNWRRHVAAQSILLLAIVANFIPSGVPLLFMIPLALLVVT